MHTLRRFHKKAAAMQFKNEIPKIIFLLISSFFTGGNIPFLASLSNSFGPVEPRDNEKDVAASPLPFYRFVPEFDIVNYNEAPPALVSVDEPIPVVEPISVVEPVPVVEPAPFAEPIVVP